MTKSAKELFTATVEKTDLKDNLRHRTKAQNWKDSLQSYLVALLAMMKISFPVLSTNDD